MRIRQMFVNWNGFLNKTKWDLKKRKKNPVCVYYCDCCQGININLSWNFYLLNISWHACNERKTQLQTSISVFFPIKWCILLQSNTLPWQCFPFLIFNTQAITDPHTHTHCTLYIIKVCENSVLRLANKESYRQWGMDRFSGLFCCSRFDMEKCRIGPNITNIVVRYF